MAGNILIMTFTNLEKYLYSKKSLKQRRQPPTPPSSKVEGIFAPLFSRGDRGATMHGRRWGTYRFSFCQVNQNNRTSLPLLRLPTNQLKVFDCQGLEGLETV